MTNEPKPDPTAKLDIDALTKEERLNVARKIQEQGVVDFISDAFETAYEAMEDDKAAWATVHQFRRVIVELAGNSMVDPSVDEIRSWLVAVSAAAVTLAGTATALFDAYANASPADEALVRITADGMNLLKRTIDEDTQAVSNMSNKEAN
mgnify:FL=1